MGIDRIPPKAAACFHRILPNKAVARFSGSISISSTSSTTLNIFSTRLGARAAYPSASRRPPIKVCSVRRRSFCAIRTAILTRMGRPPRHIAILSASFTQQPCLQASPGLLLLDAQDLHILAVLPDDFNLLPDDFRLFACEWGWVPFPVGPLGVPHQHPRPRFAFLIKSEARAWVLVDMQESIFDFLPTISEKDRYLCVLEIAGLLGYRRCVCVGCVSVDRT